MAVNEDTDLNAALNAADADGDPLTCTVVTPPANGTLTAFDATTGAFTYVPNAGYSGPDSFTFRANDGQADGNAAAVSITVTPPPEPEVTIDIIPGDPANEINLKKNGTIEVAVFSSAGFDATQIDLDSLRFGRTGTEDSLSRHPKHGLRYRLADLNGDGLLDLVVTIDVSKTGFQAGDAVGILTGRVFDGTRFVEFSAEDAVSVKSSKKGR